MYTHIGGVGHCRPHLSFKNGFELAYINSIRGFRGDNPINTHSESIHAAISSLKWQAIS
jgi:hypothetical protein